MRILHYYDKDNEMISQHVQMLTASMGLEAENHLVTVKEQAQTLLKGGGYDLLHLHGCWRNSSRSIVQQALKTGVRLILTPHGQLEPWVLEERRWKEKLPKQLLYQRSIVEQAYAVIIQGSMELECMEQLKWNPRTVVIRNAVITSSITASEMARQTYSLYRKVMDSNPLELMNSETRTALKAIITAGITGDRRWTACAVNAREIEWRKLLCYAHQEQVTDTIRRGVRVLGLEEPDMDASTIDYFVPKRFQQAESIQKTIGNQFVSENDRLIASFRYLHKLTADGQLGIKHLVELDRELRQHACEEEELGEQLKEHHLWRLASRFMQIMADRTGLTEGFMPIAPTDDRTAHGIRKQIDNHLKI